jgi:hypothetical protein
MGRGLRRRFLQYIDVGKGLPALGCYDLGTAGAEAQFGPEDGANCAPPLIDDLRE